ncbi:MAG: cytidine deaminase family protein [Ruminococcus sp.]
MAIVEEKKMDSVWIRLYEEAKKVLHPRKVSEWIEVGGVAAAIETTSGNIYTGICVDGACTLGICAERNAIFNMLTNGENEIKKVIAINWEGKAMPPCGTCRELMTQLMPKDYPAIEVMLDWEKKEIVTLGELTPKWWI